MKQFRTFFTLLFVLIFTPFIPLFASHCGVPVFDRSFQLGSKNSGDLVNAITTKSPGHWCHANYLCPVGVLIKQPGPSTEVTCNTASAQLQSNWITIFADLNAGTYSVNQLFAASAFNGNTGDYYKFKLCSICKNANSTTDGSGQVLSPTPDPLDGNSPPPPNTQTSVAVGGFDKLDNPLGPAKLTTISDVIERALGIIIKISIPFVVLMLIWTGFQFVIAQGNETKITSAKKQLMWVIVGAAILIGCVAIANAIANSVEKVAEVASGK